MWLESMEKWGVQNIIIDYLNESGYFPGSFFYFKDVFEHYVLILVILVLFFYTGSESERRGYNE
jgi:hypothetical protein